MNSQGQISEANVGLYYTLLGRMPSAVGYQPTLASEMGDGYPDSQGRLL